MRTGKADQAAREAVEDVFYGQVVMIWCPVTSRESPQVGCPGALVEPTAEAISTPHLAVHGDDRVGRRTGLVPAGCTHHPTGA